MSGINEDAPLLEPADRREWRAWLEQHHATSAGIWVAIGKKGGTRTSLTYEDAVEEALCFGWIDSIVKRLDAERFRQRMTPRKRGGIWARSNKERVARLIEQGRMTSAGLAVVEAARADGSWNLLDEIDSLVVPDDLASALDASAEAARGFSGLPESSRKQVLYWIATARRPETRRKRIEETVRAAAERRAPGPVTGR